MTLRLYRDAGQIATIGTPPIILPLGRAVGGTTLINSGTCFRTPARVLERWAREDGVAPLARRAVFDHVEDVIGVAEVPAALAGRNALLVKRGAEALGLSGGFLRRNAPGCRGSGVCAFGCPTGAKQHAAAQLAAARRGGRRARAHRREGAPGAHAPRPRRRRAGARADRAGADRRRRLRRAAHARPAAPVGRALARARAPPDDPSRQRRARALRRADRPVGRGAAVLLRRRPRRRGDHARGHRRAARPGRARHARQRRRCIASGCSPRAAPRRSA